MTVKVKISGLIAALKKHKERHQEDYKKAVIVYFDDIAEAIDKQKTAMINKDLKHNFSLSFLKPVDNTTLYDKYIGMFEMSVEPELTITTEDYGCIVDDNWSWAISASMTNAVYSNKFGK